MKIILYLPVITDKPKFVALLYLFVRMLHLQLKFRFPREKSRNETPSWLRSQNGEQPWIFRVTGANQKTQKLLFTDLGKTKINYWNGLMNYTVDQHTPTRRKRVSLHTIAVLSGAPLSGEAAKTRVKGAQTSDKAAKKIKTKQLPPQSLAVFLPSPVFIIQCAQQNPHATQANNECEKAMSCT